MLELQKDELVKQSEELQRQADILEEQHDQAQEDRERAMLPRLIFKKVDVTSGGRKAVLFISNTGEQIQDLQILIPGYAQVHGAQITDSTNYEEGNGQSWRMLFSGDFTTQHPEEVEFGLSFQVINESYWHVPCVMENLSKIKVGKFAPVKTG